MNSIYILHSTQPPNLHPYSQHDTSLPGRVHPSELTLCPFQEAGFPLPPEPPGRSLLYQDVGALRLLPSGWAGAVVEFEYPVLLGRDKEVPWQ